MRPLKFVLPAKEAFVFMLLFASTVGALLSQVVGCIYGYLAYREVREIYEAGRCDESPSPHVVIRWYTDVYGIPFRNGTPSCVQGRNPLIWRSFRDYFLPSSVP